MSPDKDTEDNEQESKQANKHSRHLLKSSHTGNAGKVGIPAKRKAGVSRRVSGHAPCASPEGSPLQWEGPCDFKILLIIHC